MIVTLTMNPAVDKTAEVDQINQGALHRLMNVVMDAGGKGINVSKTLKNLGEESYAFGVLAGNSGAYIQKEMDRLNIKNAFMYIEGNTRTNLKIIDKNKILTEFNENGPTPNEEQLNILKNTMFAKLRENDILVISGSVPKGVQHTYYYELIKEAKEKGIKTILDADGMLFKEGIEAIPNVIKPNRYELLQYFNKEEDTSDEELLFLAKTFLKKGIECIVISMGKEGAYFINKNKVIKADALKIKVQSSVGAGDAMVAALAYGIKNKYSLEELACLCSACGAGAVMSEGTKPAEVGLINTLKKQVIYHLLEKGEKHED